MKKRSKKEYADLLATNDGNCIACNLPMGKEVCLDYEDWPTHYNCLGPYDAFIDVEKTGKTVTPPMTSEQLNIQLLRLITSISSNANAYDDDLADTWETVLKEWRITQSQVNKYIEEVLK